MYTTEAIVCGTYPTREHDATVRLYTKDAGMLFARASGMRAGQSKLRYALQDFSHARVSLVRGRLEWRVTGAVSIHNLYYAAKTRSSRSALLASMRAVRRLIQGSGTSSHIFDMVIESMQTLAQGECDPLIEQVFLARLLYQLGYVAPGVVSAELLNANTIAEAYQVCLTEKRTHALLLRTVEEALVASHL